MNEKRSRDHDQGIQYITLRWQKGIKHDEYVEPNGLWSYWRPRKDPND